MIIRGHKKDGFTIISNKILQNEDLSWEARGLLCYLLSLPESWELHVSELATRSPAGAKKNRRIINELIAAGHLRRAQPRDGAGHFRESIWDVVEFPNGDEA